MNQYQEEYKRKLVTMEQALASLKDGDVIGTSQCANEPTAFLDSFSSLYGCGKHFRMFAPMCFVPHQFFADPRTAEVFDTDITFLMGPTRTGHDNRILQYYPGDLHSGASRWLQVNGCNVFIAAVTPMDKHGFFRMPLCLIHERVFLEAADRVILQVNRNLPYVFGDTEISIRDVDMIVEADTPIPILEPGELSDVERTIGGYIASMIHDGDCIQLGIGGIPDAAAQALMDKHDLGIHSEMITNSMADLIEAGVVTGKRKNFMPCKVVGTFAYGNQRLYDMMDQNPGIMLLRGALVNSPDIVSMNDNFISINSCISVDLTGQVCSESIGSRQWSGSGGQIDMALGASHSKNGRNVIAAASTKAHGTISTITAQLAPGSVVTLGRNEIDYVVTEYGIAPLRGRSIRKRVENLIAIAHPDFRAELRRQADELNLW